MKNSAWYHKLWLKKLDQYPLKDDADSSWTEMKGLLNEHLPLNDASVTKKASRFSGGTIISMLSFVLPAAAMIGAVTFIAVKHPFKNKNTPKQHYELHAKGPKNIIIPDSLSKIDSLAKTDSNTVTLSKNGNIKPADSTGKTGGNNNKSQAIQRALLAKRTTKPVFPILPITSTTRNSLPDSITAIPGYVGTTGQKSINQNNLTQQLAETNHHQIPGSAKQNENNTGVSVGSQSPGALKAASAGGFSKITVSKQKSGKQNNSVKDQKSGTGSSAFDFSIESALNTSAAGSNLLLGVWGNSAITPKLQINAGIRLEFNRSLSGEIIHSSYRKPDTIGFKVTDTRKVNTVSIPITLAYKVSNTINVFAGPQFSFSAGQSQHNYKLQPVANYRDTLSHSHSIDSALKYNSISKFNVGITGGVSVRVSPHFSILGLYQQNITPYKVNSGLGNYNQYYHSVQLGIRYNLKNKK